MREHGRPDGHREVKRRLRSVPGQFGDPHACLWAWRRDARDLAAANRSGEWETEVEGEVGFCQACTGGVLKKRGAKFVCGHCGTTYATNPSAPAPAREPKGGHTGGNNRDKHTKSHPSRTGQKKKLKYRR